MDVRFGLLSERKILDEISVLFDAFSLNETTKIRTCFSVSIVCVHVQTRTNERKKDRSYTYKYLP